MSSARAIALLVSPWATRASTSVSRAVRASCCWRGLSQEQLAERSDLNRSYVGEIERGQVVSSLVTIQKLSTALDISASGLLQECEATANSRFVQRIKLTAIAC
ncbi:helix-turn-helix domain-containing protein [Rhodoferax saidenbachensis]